MRKGEAILGSGLLVAFIGAVTWASVTVLHRPGRPLLAWTPTNSNFPVIISSPSLGFAEVHTDGNVRVNWKAAEQSAASNAIAKMLIAVRDGTYETLPDEGEAK